MKRLYRTEVLWFSFSLFLMANITMLFRSNSLGFGLKMIGLIITVWFLALLLYSVLIPQARIVTALKILIISSLPSTIFSIWQLYSFYAFGYIPKIPFIDFFPLPHEESLLHRSYMFYLPGIPRVMGFLAEPNSYGLFLALCLTSSFYLIFLHRKRSEITEPWRRIIIFSMCLNLPVLVFTFSRSGWLTLVFGMTILLLYNKKLSFKNFLKAKVFLGVFIFTALIATTTLITSSNVLERRLSFSEMEAHINTRLAGLEFVKEHPWFGIGYGNYGAYKGMRFGVSSTHSYYLNFLVEGGIYGFFSFIIFCLSLLMGAHSRRNRFGYVLIFMVLFNNIFYHTFFLEITWITIGIAIAFGNLGGNAFEKDQKYERNITPSFYYHPDVQS
ncbi:MAG: O-antigen ligase family protein [Thermodesulfobacteriota bacterium]|nr:O-antigen ligase family protein [Thermodesulfobacteriota bacterium]